MGTVQSQTPDQDGVPRYNYHENVLRDAQTAFASCDTETTASDHGDDQYFSAEESDSVKSSLTPERTRPESSSDDHLSDSHDSNDDNTLENSERSQLCEGYTWMHQGDVQAEVDTNATRTQASLHLQQSGRSFCELTSSAEKSGNSVRGTTDNPGLNQNISLQKRNTVAQLSKDQGVSISSQCHFVPIDPTSDSFFSNSSSGNEKSIAISGKRKMQDDSTREVVVPSKRMLTRSSEKRKRLGYPDSSESETDENVKEYSRKSYKKGKTILQSSKKSRRFDRDFRDRDSDERRFGKRRLIKDSKSDYDSERSESDDAKTNYLNKTTICNKKRHKYSSNSSSDNSEETPRYQKKRRSKRIQAKDIDEINNKSYKHVGSQCDDTNVDKDAASQQSQETQVNLSEGTKQMVISNNLEINCADTSGNTDMPGRPCHTDKMGSQSLRNAHGKVFPLKLVSQKNSACTTADQSTQSLSASSDLGSVVANIRPTNSVSVSLHYSGLQESEVLQAGKSFNNLHTPVRQPSATASNMALLHTNSDGSFQETLDTSPFKNVILVPPSTNRALKCRPEQPAIDKMTKRFETEEEQTSDMEVEDSDIIMENHSDSQFIDFVPPNMRIILQSKRRQKTVAARFKTFWTEKKKNLGENLKSFFHKVHSPSSETSQNSVRPVWQTFIGSSRSSQNTGSVLKSSQNTKLQFPMAHYNRSPLQKLMVAPVLQNHVVFPEQHQTEKLTVQPFENTGQMSETSMSQHSVLTSDVSRNQMVNHNSVITKEPQQVQIATGSKLAPSALATASSLVEWLPQIQQYQILDCCLAGVVNISIKTGDIADQKTAGIVNWTDGALTHTVTSCSRSVAAKAGALMRASCSDYIESKGSNLEAPDVLTTPAGGRFDRAVETILHVVEPAWVDRDEAGNNKALMETYANCLRFACERLGLGSISFPLIGNGTFPFSMCVKSFFDAVLVFLAEQSDRCSMLYIQLIIPDITAASLSADLVRSYLEPVCAGGLESEIVNTYNHYFGHKQNVYSGAKLNVSACSPDENVGVERTISGRPRLKRPRL